MQLTLTDFDCKASPPEWLSREKWEDILALSVLPGPMDSICIDLAMHSHEWKEWYESPYPEKLLLPVRGRKEDDIGHQDRVDYRKERYQRPGKIFCNYLLPCFHIAVM